MRSTWRSAVPATRTAPARAAAAATAAAVALLGAACGQGGAPAAPAPVPSPTAPATATAAAGTSSYRLAGDAAGSKFEGIGYDAATSTFYVSEVTGGEVHRGRLGENEAQEWLPGDADGRYTARGITVDDAGRVYIAGGPNGIDHPGAPDLWVYDRDGKLLTSLDTGVDRAFLNDVALGPDGAAYFTNSNAPLVFRVAQSGGTWGVTKWADATATIATPEGFNLGGIVATPDGAALVVAQGNVGKLWRFDLRSAAATEIAVTGATLKDADGLVLQDDRLTAVRNFAKALTTVRLTDGWTKAAFLAEEATPTDRVLTTAKIAGDRLLVIDSKFDEQQPQAPYEVVALPLP
jgi:sugar lactone lactonase YvrE